MLNDDVKNVLAHWDNKITSDLEALYSLHSESIEFFEELLSIIQDQSVTSGISWLIKKYLEDDGEVTSVIEEGLLSSLNSEWEWSAKLHVLQCLPYLTISAPFEKQTVVFIRECLKEKNKFVKAWAYNGMAVIALQYPGYLDETKRLLGQAMDREAASVKARIRNIFKEHPEFLI